MIYSKKLIINILFEIETTTGMKSNNLVWSWRNARFTAVIAAIPVLINATGRVEADCHCFLGHYLLQLWVYLQLVNSVGR